MVRFKRTRLCCALSPTRFSSNMCKPMKKPVSSWMDGWIDAHAHPQLRRKQRAWMNALQVLPRGLGRAPSHSEANFQRV
eukprot:92445-Chlamydomonas_euryale.AAC.1